MDIFDRYEIFRENYPSTVISVNGIQWNYLAGGSGAETLLLLPGGARQPGMGFETVLELADRYRIISPSYPLLCRMKPLTDGLAAILEAESVSKAFVFGGSFGGLVGQYFLKEYPDRISKLIISNTGTLVSDRDYVKKFKRSRAMLKFVPDRVIRGRAVKSFTSGIPFPESDLPFYEQFLRESFSKKVVLCHFSCLIDFQESFSVPDLAQWTGQMLIISARDDGFVGKESLTTLRSAYPAADFHVFDSGGHALSLTRHDEYIELITSFFDRESRE